MVGGDHGRALEWPWPPGHHAMLWLLEQEPLLGLHLEVTHHY